MNRYITLIGLCIATVLPAIGQSRKDSLSTKVVDVVKSYAPTIADANKKREDAKLKDSLTVKKKKIAYSINSVPVASTFVPEKGKPAVVKPKVIREDYTTSYVGGGVGLLSTLYADANITYPLTDKGRLSLLVDHISVSDDNEDIIPEMNYSLTDASLHYDYQGQEMLWGLKGYFGRSLHNWYGIRPNVFTRNDLRGKVDDMQQIYLRYGVGGYLQWQNPYFKGLDFSVDALGDHFNSKEVNLKAQPTFEVPLTEEQLVRAHLLLDYYEGSFSRQHNTLNELTNRWMLFGLTPSYQLMIDNLSLRLGVSLLYVDANRSDQDKFKAYPAVEATYTLSDDAILISGIKGTMQQNTLSKLSKENPFVAPMLELKPTNVQADAFVGINGKVTTDLQYRLQASYRQSKEKPLFTTFTETPTIASEILPYQYYNAFKVVYDEVNDVELLATLSGKLKDIVNFTFEGQYNHYKARTQIDNTAWNLPSVKVSLYTDFRILPTLYAGMDIFYIGNRYDLDYVLPTTITPEKITLNGYLDVNLHADYTFSKHWQVFLKANNLSTQRHTLWAYYPSQGLQIYGGVRYLF